MPLFGYYEIKGSSLCSLLAITEILNSVMTYEFLSPPQLFKVVIKYLSIIASK